MKQFRIGLSREHGPITLVYGVPDREPDQAVVLRDYLADKLSHHR